MKICKPKIKQIIPKVYVVTMDNQYDLAMTFCRFQEYYESPDMHGKRFTFMEFMKYYSMKWGKPKGSFSYPDDWNGFNIPGNVIRNCLIDNFRQIQKKLDGPLSWRPNEYGHEYDQHMVYNILDPIVKRNKGWDFYLIGVHTDESKRTREALISHEVAHGLYFTNLEYQKDMDVLLKQTSRKVLNYMKSKLKEKGYTKHVMMDEIQAHLSTGLVDNMDPKKVKKEKKLFFKVIKKYRKKAVQHDEKFKKKK